MKKSTLFASVLWLLFFGSSVAAQSEQVSPMSVFGKWVGKSWESGHVNGEFHDISVWKWAVPGKVIVATHSMNAGAYSGITLIHYDAERKEIVTRYATSAGFYTDGVLTPTETGFGSHEMVKGAQIGISEVKAGMDFVDGEMRVWSQYLKDGEWTPIERRTYRERK